MMAAGILKSHKIRAFLFYPLYWISKIWPRDRHLWLFGPMNNAFLDNAKYLFLHILNNHPELNVFFVTDKRELLDYFIARGLPVIYKWSFKGIYYGLRARFYIISAYVDDVNFWTSGGAIVFNLWHGIPLKKIEFDIHTGPLARRYHKRSMYLRLFKPYFYRRPDFVLSTSPEISRIFASAFRVGAERCPALGYPRTDIFFRERTQIWQHIEKYEPPETKNVLQLMQAYRHVLLYMPTWRDDRSNFLGKALPDVQKLNAILAEQQALLLIKLHPNDASLQGFTSLSNIRTLPAKLDLYPILPFTTALITDYSSIYFDYLLLKKPIVFYPFDLDEYLRLRELYFDYETATCPPVVHDFGQLCQRLSRISDLCFNEKCATLSARFWTHYDGQSSERIVRFLKAHVRRS